MISILCWCNTMSSAMSSLSKTHILQADFSNAQKGKLVPSRLCGLYIWNQPERKESLGWGLTACLWDWTGQGVCLPFSNQPWLCCPATAYSLLALVCWSVLSHNWPWTSPPYANRGGFWCLVERSLGIPLLSYSQMCRNKFLFAALGRCNIYHTPHY